jgi:hypothetical protein
VSISDQDILVITNLGRCQESINQCKALLASCDRDLADLKVRRDMMARQVEKLERMQRILKLQAGL